MLSRLAALVCLIASVFAGPALAQGVRTGHLEAELVRQTAWAAPGSTVYIALRQDIDPGWHTYWINPGDTGSATDLDWAPAPGLVIGEPIWPTPGRILTVAGSDRFSSYAYEGAVLTPIPVEVPAWAAPGTSVQLRLTATFFVCSDTLCIPETAQLSLELPVREGRPGLDPRWGQAVSRALEGAPQPGNLSGRFSVAGGVISLSFAGPELAGVELDGAYFLPERQGVLNQAAVQRVERGASGVTLSAPIGQTLVPLTGPITGVLSTPGGAWRVTAEAGAPLAGSFGEGPAQPAALNGPLGAAEAPLGVWKALLFAFLGGLILNVMPCVFPVLTMKAASLAGAATRPGSARVEGLAFLGGVLAAFLALAGLLLAARAGGEAVGWGFQLQSPAVVLILALVMLAAGLNLSGLFHVGASAQRLGSAAQDSLRGPLAGLPDWAGSALTGVLAVLVAAPCTAPFMAAALGFALTQTAWIALAVFAALGLGFALPFVAVSFSPALLKSLPKPGPWLSRTKAVLALPMYAAALWLGWVFLRQAGSQPTAALAGAAVALVAALWLLGRRQAAEMEGWRQPPVLAVPLAACVLALGLTGWAMLQPRTPLSASVTALASEPWSHGRVTALAAEGRPVLVNFTADWCLTCKTNEAAALSSRRVAQALERTNAVYLVGDWTLRDPEIAEELARHGRSGVPLYLVYPASGGSPEALPQLLTEGMVVAALERAAAR